MCVGGGGGNMELKLDRGESLDFDKGFSSHGLCCAIKMKSIVFRNMWGLFQE